MVNLLSVLFSEYSPIIKVVHKLIKEWRFYLRYFFYFIAKIKPGMYMSLLSLLISIPSCFTSLYFFFEINKSLKQYADFKSNVFLKQHKEKEIGF